MVHAIMEPGFIQGFLFGIWLLYIIFKDVAMPLFKALRNRKQPQEPMTPTEKAAIAARVPVLELTLSKAEANIVKVEARVIDFERLLEEQGTAIDNKLDLVLDEMRQFGERMARMETHFEHLQRDVEDLKDRKRRSGIGD